MHVSKTRECQVTKKTILAATVSLALAGCATTPIPTDEAVQVRTGSKQFSLPKEGHGKLVVKRDQGLNTGACSTKVFVDGISVADIGRGEKVVLYVPLGEHIVSAVANGICAGGLIETTTHIGPERAAILRIGYGSNGEFTLQPTAF